MSDSSSDEEDDEDTAKRLNEELKGVEDEDALRQLVISDEEDEEEEQKRDDNKLKKETDQASNKIKNDKKLVNNESNEPMPKIKQEKKSNSTDESDSSDEDFDDNKFQSSIFMQKNEIKKESTHDQQGIKRKLDTSNTQQQPLQSSSTNSSAKRPRVNGPETNLEETVKRYLMRKPITTTELIKNVRKMKVTNSKDDLVAVISQILKKLDPTKQMIQDKLYLYLNPREQNKNL
jgi:transcription initiation factor TFIIF subunit alpha